jgi:hypothetical protein
VRGAGQPDGHREERGGREGAQREREEGGRGEGGKEGRERKKEKGRRERERGRQGQGEGGRDRKEKREIEREEKESARYIETYFNRLWNDPHLYHLVINLSKVSFEQAVDIIELLVRDIER